MLEKTLKFIIFVSVIVITMTLLRLYEVSKDTNEKLSEMYDDYKGKDRFNIKEIE